MADFDPHNLSKVQRERLGNDLFTLGLRSTEFPNEVRFDSRKDRDREIIDRLLRYNLVAVREHAGGEGRILRVSLTEAGRDLAHEREVVHATKQAMSAATRQGGGVEPIGLPPDPILVTTQTLVAFTDEAGKRGFSRQLAEDTVNTLDPNGRHRVKMAWKHTSSEGFKNIRLQMDLSIKSSVMRQAETRAAVVDISQRDWDMLMVPHHQRARRENAIHGAANILYMAAPKWEATRSFGVVHELTSFYQGHVAAYNRSGWTGPFTLPGRMGPFDLRSSRDASVILRGDAALDFMRHPRSLYNSEFAEYLQVSHPVVVDPEWVEIQEDWAEAEAWAYASRAVLPFDPLYLDFMGAGGRLPEVVAGGRHVGICGCLIFTDHEGRRVIVPVGGRQYLDPLLGNDVLAGGLPFEPLGRIVLTGAPCAYGHNIEVHADGRDLFTVAGAYEVPVRIDNLSDVGLALDLPPYDTLVEQSGESLSLYVDDVQSTPGYVELPLRPEEALARVEYGDEDGETKVGAVFGFWYALTRLMATKAVSMLSLMDNENVELRKADVSRQVRREVQRQQKKGRSIDIASEIVVVRKTRYVNGNKETSEGGGIEYSHQFRVKRHEQHHGPHTPAYRAKPHLAKPCGRCGSCRRFIVDSYIKGPANKPLKLNKTYVFHGEDR